MTEIDQVRYEAFFDELGQLEKRAMLEKTAVTSGVVPALSRFGRSLVGVAKRLTKVPLRGEKGVGAIVQRGYKRGVRQWE